MKNLEKIAEKFMKDKRFKLAMNADKRFLNKNECRVLERLLNNKHRNTYYKTYNHCIRELLNNKGHFTSYGNACAISNLIWWNIGENDCSLKDKKIFERLKIELDATLDIYSLFYHILSTDYNVGTMEEVNKILKIVNKNTKRL